jgi:hypothetical protein
MLSKSGTNTAHSNNPIKESDIQDHRCNLIVSSTVIAISIVVHIIQETIMSLTSHQDRRHTVKVKTGIPPILPISILSKRSSITRGINGESFNSTAFHLDTLVEPKVLLAGTILHTPTNHGNGWSSRIIILIWTHCHNAWLDRNQALHGHHQQTKHLARQHRAQFRIRSLYDLRNQWSQFDCNCWFNPSIEELFSRVPVPTQLENLLT